MADIAALGLSIDSTAAIKATADLDAFVGGANRAADANAKLAASSTQAASAQASASEAAAAASTASASAADRLLATVEKQIALFGASADAVAHYNGVMAGMTSSELEWYKAQTLTLEGMREQAAAAAALASARDAQAASQTRFLDSLREQVATMGLSRAELAAYRAEQLGVTEAAAPLIAAIEAQTAAMAKSASAAAEMEKQAAATAQAAKAAADLAEAEAAAAARISAMVAESLKAVDTMNDNTVAAQRYAASLDEVAAAATAAEHAGQSMSATTVGVGSEAVTAQTVAMTPIAGGAAADAEQAAAAAAKLAAAKKVDAAASAEAAAAGDALKVSTSGLTSEILVLFRELGRGDMSRFGGSLTRLISLAGATSLLFNPLTLGAIALGAAFVKVENEDSKLNEALALTNGYVGETTSSLKLMADSISSGGATIGVANEALAALAASGRVSGLEIEKLGTATADAATYTGVSVKQMVADFTSLQDEPLKASVKLNEQYHYLTAATFDQIDALMKQGDAIGAAQVAQSAFADASIAAADKIKASEGPILKFWQDLKGEISGVVEAIGSIGATAGPAEVVARDLANKAARQPIGQWSPDDEAGLQKEIAARDAAATAARKKAAADTAEQQRQTATVAYETWQRQFWTPQQKEAQAVQDYMNKIATPLNLSPEQQIADESNISARYKDKKVRGGNVDAAQGQQDAQGLKDQFSAQQKLDQDNLKVLQDDQKAKLIGDTAFYAAEQQLNDQDLANKLSYYSKLEALLKADIASSSTNTVQKIKDQTQINSLMSDSNVAVADYAARGAEIDAAQAKAADDKTAAVHRYVAALQDQLNKQAEAASAQVATAGGGKPAGFAAQAQSKESVAATGLQQQLYSGKIDTSQYAQEIQAQQDYEAQSVALHQATTQKIAQADDSWSAGAEKAWSSWSSQAQNTTGQVATATTSFLNGLTDDILKFAETGRINFQSLAASFVNALAKMEIQAAESKVFNLIQGGLTGGTGLTGGGGLLGSLLQAFGMGGASTATMGLSAGIGSDVAAASSSIADTAGLGLGSQFAALASGFATGGHVTGAGTGTSDSIPARLSNGEFVVNAEATSRHLPLLHAMNGGRGTPGQTHFATGGYVAGGASAPSATNIAFNISSGTSAAGQGGSGSGSAGAQGVGKNMAMQKELQAAVIEIVRKHSQPGGQINQIIRSVGPNPT